MARGVPFTKMHGLGNDFVVVDARLRVTAAKARSICDRRLGVGCDQLLQVKPKGRGYDAEMLIWNPDGSRAEMCGNGIRAVALWMRENGWRGREFKIKTLGGIKHVAVRSDDSVRVNMGAPEVGGSAVQVQGRELWLASLGNPHAVSFVDDVASLDLERVGRPIETDPLFPNRTNVEFVRVVSRRELEVRVWERGAGATLACGTGASAAAVVAIARGLVDRKVRVRLPGGVLLIEWSGVPGADVFMTGPAVKVFRGEMHHGATYRRSPG